MSIIGLKSIIYNFRSQQLIYEHIGLAKFYILLYMGIIYANISWKHKLTIIWVGWVFSAIIWVGWGFATVVPLVDLCRVHAGITQTEAGVLDT